MIFIVFNAKMVGAERENPAIQIHEEPNSNSTNCFYHVRQVVSTERTKRQAVGDLLVTFVALPLLIACAILLYSFMRLDWVRDGQMRVRVLALGLSLLLISLLVCVYATQRLGICVWPSAEQQAAAPQGRIRRRTLSARSTYPAPLLPSDSQIHLMVGGELPPSYDSVIGCADFPPPYTTMSLFHEKGEVTRSTLSPLHAGARPPGTG